MTAAELQQRLAQSYDRARWLDTLRQILPRTEIFSTPQAIAAVNTRTESILHLGKILLAGDRNLALLEVIVDENTDLPGNRAALRHLVARYIDQAEYHGVFAIFHQRKAKDYRFTFAARETALDDSGQLVRTETAPRRYTYLLGPNESCRTAAERFDLLARKAERTGGAIDRNVARVLGTRAGVAVAGVREVIREIRRGVSRVERSVAWPRRTAQGNRRALHHRPGTA